MADFEEWTIERAKKAVEASVGDQKDAIKSNKLFYEGDHWQTGSGYVGPMPTGAQETTQIVETIIKDAFVSRNAIKEIVDRHANGILGRRVQWSLVPRRPLDDGETPTTEEDQIIREANAILAEWIDAQEITDLWQQIGSKMLYAGSGPIRLFVPPDQVENGAIPIADIETSLHRIYVEVPDASQAAIYTDRRSQRKAAIYVYKEGDQDAAELAYTDGAQRGAQGAPQTVIRQIMQDASKSARYALNLGGRLPIHLAQRPILITPQIRSLQRTLNLSMTMKQRNVILAGFLERTLLNANLPGKIVKDELGNNEFVPQPLEVGAGVVNSLIGISYTDGENNTRYMTPDIRYKDPISVQTFLDTEESTYQNILAEAHQLHYAIINDGATSGIARLTAMADYIADLLTTKRQIDRAYSWLLETVLAMAATFSGDPDRFKDYRIAADAQLDPGPISPEMIRAVNEIVNDRLISRETGMNWIGIEDAKAENQKISEEQEQDASASANAFAPLLNGIRATQSNGSGTGIN